MQSLFDYCIVFLYNYQKSVTFPVQTVLIRVKAFHYERKEMKALDDSKIVEMYLVRDEDAIKQPEFVWHNEPFNHEISVKDGQTVDIVVEWSAV